ncbi:diguanylate cyclase [Candidatus Omnitrophota bacterium]
MSLKKKDNDTMKLKDNNIHYTSLIASSDSSLLQNQIELLQNEGHTVSGVDSLENLISALSSDTVDLVVFDYRIALDGLEDALKHVREQNKRTRIILLIEEHTGDWRGILKLNLVHSCCDVTDNDEKFLLCVDTTLRNLPMIDLLSQQFEKIKSQIKVSEKNKEGLRYIISAMPETINRLQPLDKFIRGVLIQMCGFLNADDSFLATFDQNEQLIILVGTGRFDINEKAFLKSSFHAERAKEIKKATEDYKTTVGSNFMLIPLKAKDRVIGIFYLEKQTEEFDPLEEDMMKLFASQAAITIENSNLFTLATQDGLTGLFVRRHFMQRFQEVLQYASRMGGQPVSFLISDIDHFKSVNDTYGHQTGDIVLIEVAKVLSESVRATDLVGRLGGEEFAILLVNTSVDEARAIAEKIREAVKKLSFESEGKEFKTSISIGISSFPSYVIDKEKVRESEPNEVVEKDQNRMVSAADAALYQSKENGRDQVTISDLLMKEE